VVGFRWLLGFRVCFAQNCFFDATGFTVIFRIARMREYVTLLAIIQSVRLCFGFFMNNSCHSTWNAILIWPI
jgi:hypothetical protein